MLEAADRLDDDALGGRGTHACSVSLYNILFHFKALLWESIILLLPSSHLQSPPYCITIARPLRNIRPPPTLLLYAIHHTRLVMAISCKGETLRYLLHYRNRHGARPRGAGDGWLRSSRRRPHRYYSHCRPHRYWYRRRLQCGCWHRYLYICTYIYM